MSDIIRNPLRKRQDYPEFWDIYVIFMDPARPTWSMRNTNLDLPRTAEEARAKAKEYMQLPEVHHVYTARSIPDWRYDRKPEKRRGARR